MFSLRDIWQKFAGKPLPYTREELKNFYRQYLEFEAESKQARLAITLAPASRRTIERQQPKSFRKFCSDLKKMTDEERANHLRKLSLGYAGARQLPNPMIDLLMRSLPSRGL